MSSFEKLAEAVEANSRVLAGVLQTQKLMIEAGEKQTKLLEAIHQACTKDIPESALTETVSGLATAVQEQTGVLRDVRDAIDGQPEAIRAAVREALHGED